jgi:tetratricopeptide (TPR) repeat protein
MKRKMLTICLVVVLISTAVVCAGEKTEEASVAEKAFQLRLDGKSHEAKEVLTEYLKEHPDDAVAQFEYSRVLCYLFDLESAEKHAALAVQLDEDNPRFHYWEGMCGTYLFIDQAHHKGNLDGAIVKRSIAALQKAIELKPDYHLARYLLVNLLNNNPPEHGGDQKQARKHTEYLIETDLDYGLQAMMVVEGEKSLDWKIEQYKEALAKEPENAGLHAGIALLYVESNQMKKSQEHIDKALELDEKQKNVLLDIVLPLVMKKQYQPAIEMTERYLDLAANGPAAMRSFALFYIAKIEKMSGNPEAEKTLKRSIQADPDVWQTMKAPPAILFEPLIATH